jgi:hypothetical protein
MARVDRDMGDATMTGTIKFDRGGKYYPTIHHGNCSEKKSPSMVLPYTVVYRHL